jgi:hypothetical protein
MTLLYFFWLQNLIGVSRLVKAVTTYSKAYTNVNSQKFTKIVTKENLGKRDFLNCVAIQAYMYG